MYNNREIASLIWITIIMVGLLFVSDVRKSFIPLFANLLERKILCALMAMAVWSFMICYLLSFANLWHAGMLKDTLAWFSFTGLFLVVDYVTSDENQLSFKAIFSDNLKAIILLEFILNTYTMSLSAEIVFIPFITMMVVLNELAKRKEDGKPIVAITGVIISTCGLSIMGYSIWEAIHGWAALDKWDTFRNFIFPPLMTVLFFPFVFLMVLWSDYETILNGLDKGVEKSKEFKKYAQKRILSHFGLRFNKLRVFKTEHYTDLPWVQTKEDVDRILNQPSEE